MPIPPQVTVGGFTKPTDATVLCTLDVDGNPVPVSAANPVPADTEAGAAGTTFVDGSGTITSGGTAQTVFAANAARRYLLILNTSDTVAYVNFGTNAVAGQPSITLAPSGGYYEPLVPPVQSVTIIGATTGKTFVAKQG